MSKTLKSLKINRWSIFKLEFIETKVKRREIIINNLLSSIVDSDRFEALIKDNRLIINKIRIE